MQFFYLLNSKKGLTLIEVLVGTFLMLIVFLGIFAAYQLGLRIITLSKQKIVATAIANQQIEIIRNLPYDLIGVEGAFPEGSLLASENITRSNNQYLVEKRVDYVVDPVDGIALPQDACPNDYKKVSIKVSWAGNLAGSLDFSTDISPKNIAQECSDAGGVLSVSVIDSFGNMIISPLVEVKDSEGEQILKSGSPTGGQVYFSMPTGSYEVVVSKPGHGGEKTYGAGEIYNGSVVAVPANPHPIVLEKQLSEITFSIDSLSSLNIASSGLPSLEYPVIPNISFNLKGSKVIGLDEDENPILKFSQNYSTNAQGNANIPALEADSYNISIIGPLDLVGLESPFGEQAALPIGLVPGNNTQLRLILNNENTLLLTIKNEQTNEPIFSASARLVGQESEYDITQYTNEQGITFFIPLDSGDYSLEIQAAGYSSDSLPIQINGNSTSAIYLEQIE